MCGFSHCALQLLSQHFLLLFLTFPSIFLILAFSTHSRELTSAPVLLFSLFLSFLFLYPSWPLYGSVPTVRLLLTNEATAWPQAAVHQGRDSWGAQPVKRHQSPLHHSSFLSLFSYIFLFTRSALHTAERMSVTDTELTWSKYSQSVYFLQGFSERGLFSRWEVEYYL